MNTATIIYIGYAFIIGLLFGLCIGLSKCLIEMENSEKKKCGEK